MEKFDYSKLTPEQKEELRKQLETEEQQKKEAAVKLRQDYEDLKSKQVNETFDVLKEISDDLEYVKVEIFNEFGAVIGMKAELYKLTPDDLEVQQSHTFTNAENNKKIIVGTNVIDRWSDDVGIGIEKVNKWIDSKVTNPEDRKTIRALLKPNKVGILKANRVLDLSKHAAERGDKELIEAVDFIRDQYRPEKTSTYVKAKYLDANGIWQYLPLSMSAV